MKIRFSATLLLRLVTFAIWLLAVLCMVYWGMKFVTVTPVKAVTAVQNSVAAPDSQTIARLLGATNSVATQAVNIIPNASYVLFGIVREGTKTGVALIATDGKPAKPYRVGSKLAEGVVLKSVSRSEAVLAASTSAPDGLKLELPQRQPAATGSNPSAPLAVGLGQMQVPPPVAAPAPVAMPTTAPTASAAVSAIGAMAAGAASPPQLIRPGNRFTPQNQSDAPREVPRIPLPASAQPGGGGG